MRVHRGSIQKRVKKEDKKDKNTAEIISGMCYAVAK
jgi:hypothetical protein